MPPNIHGLPTQMQLMLPLLQIIDEAGGVMRPIDAMCQLAEKFGIPASLRDAAVPSGRGRWEGRRRFIWRNRVAWTRMSLAERELIDRESRGSWRITKKGREALYNATPGVVLKIYETPSGTALWASAEDAAGFIADESVNLIWTSVPFCLARPKEYGNPSMSDFIAWLVNIGREWKRTLVSDGSLMLNLGHSWRPGAPLQSDYQERVLLAFIDELRFSYAQRLTWYSPCKRATTPWVTQQRIRLSTADEVIYWLGKTAHPFVDTSELLREYSPDHKRRLAKGTVSRGGRPSNADAHRSGSNRYKDNGGAIPQSVIVCGNSNAADPYLKRCKQFGITPHPATAPTKVVDFGIRLATRPGDVVWDPCAGSNKTGACAERLGRRWIANDISLNYGIGSALRFDPDKVSFSEGVFNPFEIVPA